MCFMCELSDVHCHHYDAYLWEVISLLLPFKSFKISSFISSIFFLKLNSFMLENGKMDKNHDG